MEKTDVIEPISRLMDEAEQGRKMLSAETGEMMVCTLLAPGVEGLITRACELLRTIEGIYESPDDGESASLRGEDGDPLGDVAALISTAVAEQEIGDLAFLTGTQLRDCIERLQAAIDGDDIMQVATNTEIGLRRMRRGLAAMRYAICTFEGWDAPALGRADLDEAVEVRRFYWELRRLVLGAGEPEEADIPSRLRNFTAVIDAFKNRPVFSNIRIWDRIQMFRVCDRVEQWLEQGEEQEAVDGRRLWQDLTAFAKLLTEINNRQELREQDRDLIELALINIGQGASHEVQLTRVLALKLRTMMGFDDALDELLVEPKGTSVERWEEVLVALQARIAAADEDLDREVFLQPPESLG